MLKDAKLKILCEWCHQSAHLHRCFRLCFAGVYLVLFTKPLTKHSTVRKDTKSFFLHFETHFDEVTFNTIEK